MLNVTHSTRLILNKWVLATLRARALRAPFFLGSLKLKTGCCAPLLPPITAVLLLFGENPRKIPAWKKSAKVLG